MTIKQGRVIKVTLPLDPVAKARARIAFTNGKVRSYTPTKTQEAESLIVAYLEEYREKCFDYRLEEYQGKYLKRPIPIKLTVVFYRVKSKWLKKWEALPFRRPDLDNMGKLICDAINGLLVADDAQITTLNLKKRWAKNGIGSIEIQLEEDKL